MENERDALIALYFDLGMTYRDLLCTLAHRHNVILSERQLKRDLVRLNLRRRRYCNLADVVDFIRNELTGTGQLHGYRMMYAKCQENGLSVRKEDVRLILRELDPNGVEERRAKRLVRRAYFAKGPNFIWHVDGYDKLKPYGLCISGCIDGFSRKLIWLNVYNTNNNPRIIGGYFLQAVEECGGCPRIVRGDYGTENGHIRALQEVLHNSQAERVYFEGASTTNQRIESWWSFLRREFTQFWMDIFKDLSDNGLFSGGFLDKNLVQFCFTSLIQGELDQTARMWNGHNIRPSSNIQVPSGRPNIMYFAPHLWGTEDKLCMVPDDDIRACYSEVELRKTIPCDSDVYDLCTRIMVRDNLNLSTDSFHVVNLYLHLRQEISQLL